jgi:hypothetical protein
LNSFLVQTFRTTPVVIFSQLVCLFYFPITLKSFLVIKITPIAFTPDTPCSRLNLPTGSTFSNKQCYSVLDASVTCRIYYQPHVMELWHLWSHAQIGASTAKPLATIILYNSSESLATETPKCCQSICVCATKWSWHVFVPPGWFAIFIQTCLGIDLLMSYYYGFFHLICSLVIQFIGFCLYFYTYGDGFWIYCWSCQV